jgi:Domain of unknown function (DUF4190)
MSEPYIPPDPQQPGQPRYQDSPYTDPQNQQAQYQQPQYQQGQYQQGQGDAQPYGYAPNAPAPTNVLAIVALVSAFFIPVAGIVCGHLALGQIKRTGENGRGLALAGLIIGYVLTALILLMIVLAIIIPLFILGTVGTVNGVPNY